MPEAESIGRLGVWEGYRVGTIQRFEAGEKGPRPQVWIELHPDPGRVKVCGRCGGACRHIHDRNERWVRDLSVFDADTHLLVHRCRVECPACGPSLERLTRLALLARATVRLAESIARLCKVLPIQHAAEFFEPGWDAVKAIDKAYLEKTLGEPDLDGLTLLAMDEFAIHKGHRYATVIIDPTSKRLLWVGKGRDRGSLRPFFEMLGPERCVLVRAVAMDMNRAHEMLKDRIQTSKINQQELIREIEMLRAKMTSTFGKYMNEMVVGEREQPATGNTSHQILSNSQEARRARMLARLQRKQQEKSRK